MKTEAKKLHKDAIVVDGHQEILDEYIFEFLGHEQEALTGREHVFDRVYAPLLKAQGVNVVNLSVGGDHVAQVMYSASELRFWDAHKKLDVLNSELEAGCRSFLLCRSADEIDQALAGNKIAILATLSGGRPLEGKPNLNLLSSLRSLYRAGLRGLQLTGNNRNRLADGVAQSRSRGRLTDFGAQVVKEAQRLGMVIDTAQLSDHGFWDVVDLAEGPIVDSHTCAKVIHPHPRNIGDDRIKAIASSGGIVGLSFRAALVGPEKAESGTKDLLRHIDHISDLVGIEHVALGPDFCAYQTPKDRNAVIGFGNLGPDVCEFDRLTPVQSEKYPGYVEGIWYGIRKSDFIRGPDTHERFPLITQALLNHGYTEAQCRLILGNNFLRVYREVLG